VRYVRGLSAAVAAGVAVGMLAGCGTRTPATGVEGLQEALAADGTTIVVGDPDAATTVRLYEDPRCPVVEDFEATGGLALREKLVRGEVQVEYTFASFKDDRLGGDGSSRAVNALRAALEAGKFAEYHTVLFRTAEQLELADGFTTTSLLKLADRIEGLRSKEFDDAVRTMKYEEFVTASEEAFEAAGDDNPGVLGTPTVVINDTDVTGDPWLFERQSFHLLLNARFSTSRSG
jgi:protein-disulfide isomerase